MINPRGRSCPYDLWAHDFTASEPGIRPFTSDVLKFLYEEES